MGKVLRASNEVLIGGHKVGERGDDFAREEVEGQPERDGEGQSRQRPAEDGQEHEGQAEADQDGDEASQSRVPVAIGGRFADLFKPNNEELRRNNENVI